MLLCTSDTVKVPPWFGQEIPQEVTISAGKPLCLLGEPQCLAPQRFSISADTLQILHASAKVQWKSCQFYS